MTALPTVPANLPPELRRWLERLKEGWEVRTSTRGSALDVSPTLQDMVDMGLLSLKDGVTLDGRKYSPAEALGLVQANGLPSWITSDTAPPAPTGVMVSANIANTIVSWDDPSAIENYWSTEVWRASVNDLSQADRIIAMPGSRFLDDLAPDGVSWYYWVRHTTQAGQLPGPFNSLVGTSINSTPGAVTSFSYAFSGPFLELAWPVPTSDLLVEWYEVQHSGDSYLSTVKVSAPNYRVRVDWQGSRTFRVRPIDVAGEPGPWQNKLVTVRLPGQVTNASYSFEGPDVAFSWTPNPTDLPIERYAIRVDGTSWATATVLDFADVTAYRTKVQWGGAKSWRFAAIDSAGNVGPELLMSPVVQMPLTPQCTVQVIDNNVLLYWTDCETTLPIATYRVLRGAPPVNDYATAVEIGTKLGLFTTVFETKSGLYKYFIIAEDSAGNLSTYGQVAAQVQQPPDYTLLLDYDSALATQGNATVTLQNALRENDGTITLPVNLVETWDQHFASRSWASPQSQIDAGYPVYIQPTLTSGFYQEVYDYGAVLGSVKVTVVYTRETVAGVPVIGHVLSVSADGTNWTDYPNVYEIFSTGFRYIKTRLTVTGDGGQALVKTTGLNIKLDYKLKTVTLPLINALAADAGGTTVYLTSDGTAMGTPLFVDVEDISPSLRGTTPGIAIYDFVDVPYPLSFKALVFNTSGARMNGTVSCTVRGASNG